MKRPYDLRHSGITRRLDFGVPDAQVGAQPDQHLRGHAVAFTDQAEQDVSGADAIVTELQRLAQPPAATTGSTLS